MRILVTGRNGQVARALSERIAPLKDMSMIFASRPKFDLGDDNSIRSTISDIGPDVVVSAAAYTAVDAAESDRETAFRYNGHAPGVIAAAANEAGARIIHLSTDYVFDGRSSAPYRETDPTDPATVYGQSKLAGERAVRAATNDHTILRTAWVHSPFGNNFVRTMLRLASERGTIRVVGDQEGSPTSAFTIADGVLTLVKNWQDGSASGCGETVHLSGEGTASWSEFASAVMAESRTLGGASADIEAISTSDYPTAAPRPANSKLDNRLFTELTGYRPPDWRDALAPIVARLV